MKSKKEILDINIHELNFIINELNLDLAEVIATYTDQESKIDILVFVDREFSKKYLSVFNDYSSFFKQEIYFKIKLLSIKCVQQNSKMLPAMLLHLIPYVGIPIGAISISLLANEARKKVRDDINQFLDDTSSKIKEYLLDINQDFGSHTNNFINQINNNLNEQHQTILYKVKQRLGKSFLSDLQPSKYYCSASTLLDDLVELMESQKTNFKENSLDYKDFLGKIYDSFEEKLNGFYNTTIMNTQIYLTKDIEIFFEKRDEFLKEYEQDLQSSFKAVQEKQNRCVILNNKYVQLLDKITNLGRDLEYQKENFKKH